MRDFHCRNCGQQLSFENTVCLNCGKSLGFHLPSRTMQVLDENEVGAVDGTAVIRCANNLPAACNWLVEQGGGLPTLCESCRLTRTRPPESETQAMQDFAEAEMAKRRVIFELDNLNLPIFGKDVDPQNGLAFDLLSSAHEPVTTGHADGVITLDLAEGNDVHREELRVSMDEPYRTLIGHFRHEIGHFYQMVLVGDGPRLARYEELFGDPNTSYQDALDRHYNQGPPEGWEQDYVSSYATMHPMEDWAETFAHYLHIRDTLDTAAAFAVAPAGAILDADLPGQVGFDRIIDWWLPLTWALNQINRSMGHQDLYPFVLPPKVLEKMEFIHELITAEREAGAAA
ncbi:MULTISPECIES: zinc-binding metallopeptidase family protein [unclassified Gordonia (in: high G+C Gram-positive bacteria)]